MPLSRFDYVSPRTIDEALDLLAEHGPRSKLIAGGTDLMPRMQRGAIQPEVVISLRRIPELRPITYDAREGLTIGAMASLADVLDHTDVRRHYPSLVDSVHQAANAQIRNMGTIAGNVCNGSSCADTAPTLLALGASALLAKKGGERVVPLDKFFLGPSETVMGRDEMMVGVRVPPTNGHQGFAYRNVQARTRVDISAASVGVGVTAGDGRVADVRIFLGAVGPTPLRALQAEEAVHGQPPDSGVFRAAGEQASEESRPITDVRATASYRRRVVAVLAQRALAEAAARAGLSVEGEAAQ